MIIKELIPKKYVQATLRRTVIEFLFLYLLVVQFDDEAVPEETPRGVLP